MKYLVLGRTGVNKTDENGVSFFDATIDNDNAELMVYWELGHEIGISRNHLIKDLLGGTVNNESTTIVTLKDRMFLYEGIFKNVLAWEDFYFMDRDGMDVSYWYCEDGVYYYRRSLDSIDFHNKLLIDTINNTKKEELPSFEKDFFVIHYRERPHSAIRNIDMEDYIHILESLKSKGLDFWVYGKNANKLGSLFGKTELSLSEANTYLTSDKCKGFITPLSGGGQIGVLSYNGTHHIMDYGGLNNNTDVVFHGDACNYVGAEIINHHSLQSMLDYLKNY